MRLRTRSFVGISTPSEFADKVAEVDADVNAVLATLGVNDVAQIHTSVSPHSGDHPSRVGYLVYAVHLVVVEE